MLRWVDQFEEDDREFLLTELNHILSQSYLSKQEAIDELDDLFNYLAKHYKYDSVKDLLSEVRILSCQPEVKSQSILLHFLDDILTDKYRMRIADWMQVRFQIMLFCIELKLIHNWETFSTILLATKNIPIVEESKKDKIWGAIDKGDYYEGVNALGRLLMYVREKIKTNPGVYNVEIPATNHLSLLGIDLKEIPLTLILAQIP